MEFSNHCSVGICTQHQTGGALGWTRWRLFILFFIWQFVYAQNSGLALPIIAKPATCFRLHEKVFHMALQLEVLNVWDV